MKTLLAISTLNQIDYTRKCMKSIPKIDNLEILFIDDCSKDDTISTFKEDGWNYVTKTKGLGLTHSWNIAYRRFKLSYDKLIISNNDVIFNEPSLISLINNLDNHTLCCPMSSKKGAGHNAEMQDVAKYYPEFGPQSCEESGHKEFISHLHRHDVVKMSRFNGFCFGVNRDIIASEYDNEHLFNKKKINTGQEGDLQNRLIKKPVVCLDSFIFHFKAITVKCPTRIQGKDSRDILERFH